MSAAGQLSRALNSLQELVTTHLIELHPPHSARHSHEYRTLIFAIYSHMRSLLAASGLSFPDREQGWDHQFIQIIETIHTAFGTQQTQPYHIWPQPEFLQ
jgi:hypothetical protein